MFQLNAKLLFGKDSLLIRFLKANLLLLIIIMLSLSGAYCQQIISGRVMSGDSALAGVSVKVKGTAIVSQTDAIGHYSINASLTSTLLFSYVGYATLEVPVNSRSTIEVSLVERLY